MFSRSPVDQWQASLIAVTAFESLVLPLSTTHALPPFLHCLQLSIAYLFIIVILKAAVHPTVYFFFWCPNSFICKYSLPQVVALVQSFWFLKHHKYWTVTETWLGYTTVAQSQGDLMARRSTWEQVPCEVQATAHFPALDISYLRLTELNLCACSLQAAPLSQLHFPSH